MTTQFLLNGNLTLRTFWFQATAKLCRQQLFIYMGSEHSYNKQMYKTNDTDKSEPLVLCTLSPWTIFLSWLWTCSFMKHSTNQHQWEDLYISEALGLLPLRLLLSPHLTAPPAITQWNTLAPGLKPTGILPIIISYVHTTAGVSASLGSLLSSLLSSVLYPPFSVCLSLSLLRLVYLRGKAFWFVWAMAGGEAQLAGP